MADYQQFEQQYPTLNKFVGAAREAASVIPGAGYLTPGGQNYQDARQRFQQENPVASAAGRGVGYGVDLAMAGGALGGIGKLAAAKNASAAAEAAMAAGGQATRGSTFSALAGQAASEQAPTFVAPTLGNIIQGGRNAAAVAGPAVSAVTQGVKTAANYAPMVAPVVGPPMLAAMRGNSSQAQQVDQTRPQTEVNASTLGEIGLSPITQSPRQAVAAAAAPQRQSVLNMPMFPGDDPRLPYTERLMLQKLSPKPHYPTGMEQMMSLGSALARKRYDAEMQRATNDAQRTTAEQNFQNTIMDIIAKGMGPHAMMNAYAAQAANPMGYGE